MDKPRRLTVDQLQRRIAMSDPLTVGRWVDPSLEGVDTFGARSDYVEFYLLPQIGPSALLALRRLAAGLDQQSEFTAPLDLLAAELGIPGGGVQGTLVRSLVRLCRFGLAYYDFDDRLLVRTLIPRLSEARVNSLPAHLAQLHRLERYAERERLCAHRFFGDGPHCAEMGCPNYAGRHRWPIDA